MKKIVIVLFVFVICASLIFGIYNIKSVDSLMRPPKLGGENSLIQQAFDETVSESDGIIMKNPLDGKYTSTYLFYDLNNDGLDEALVFYSDLTDDNMACVNIFKKTNNEWSFVSKIKGKSEEVYQVDFADFNSDGICEILLSWKAVEPIDSLNSPDFSLLGNRLLSIYSYNETSTTLLKSEHYSNYYIDDFDANDSDDLFLVNISLSDQEKKTSGRLISFCDDYSISQDISIALTGMLNVFNIVSDNVIENNKEISRIFIDGFISENAVITEVVNIVQDSFEVSLPLYEQNQSLQPSTLRDSRSISFDFDNDGEVEIPTLEKLPHSELVLKDSNEKGQLNLTVWHNLIKSRLTVDAKCIYSSSFKYMFIFPDEWINEITAVYDYNNDTLTFYYVDSSDKTDNWIMSIKAFYTSNWEKDNLDYISFTDSSTYIYGYKFYDNDTKEDYIEYIDSNFLVIV